MMRAAVVVILTLWMGVPLSFGATPVVGIKAMTQARFFQENLGQADQRVKFLSRGNGQTLFLAEDGSAVLSFAGTSKVVPAAPSSNITPTVNGHVQTPAPLGTTVKPVSSKTGGDSDQRQVGAIRMSLPGSRHPSRIEPIDPAPGVTNYLKGNDPKRWITRVRNYGGVVYHGVYPGVDLVYKASNSQIEYTFVVAPGADASRIRVGFDGAPTVDLPACGDLCVNHPLGKVLHRKPRAFQQGSSAVREVSCAFRRVATKTFGFNVEGYDRSKPLTIDPVIDFSTVIDGTNTSPDVSGMDVAVDASNNCVAVSFGLVTDMPTFNANGDVLQPQTAGDHDILIAKVGPHGDLIFRTYFGGSGYDRVDDVAIASDGSIHISGQTGSDRDFPLVNAVDSTFRYGLYLWFSHNGFTAKLTSDGTAILYSTYVEFSEIRGLAVDSAGRAYVGCATQIDGYFNNNYHEIRRYSPDGQTYDRFASIPGLDWPLRIRVDAEDNVFIAWWVSHFSSQVNVSPDQAGWNPIKADGSLVGAVTKHDPQGSLIYFTYIGGPAEIYPHSLAIDTAGSAYYCGETLNGAFPLKNSLQAPASDHDGFLVKLTPDGKDAVFSTLLGGSGTDALYGVTTRSNGEAIALGGTDSPDYPVTVASMYPPSKLLT